MENQDFMPPASPQEPLVYDLPPLKPNNWLWPAIAATILCCVPFGIVGIIYAVRVDSLYFSGMYEGAERMAQKAKMWTLIAAGAGLLYVFIWIILLVSGNLPEYMDEFIQGGASGYNF